jgi:hypothetical protein
MARRVNDLDLQATIVEGGILNASTIQKVQKLEALRQKPADYGVEKGLELRDEINRAFKILAARVADFQKSSQSVIQVRALAEHLFQRVLGFDLEFQQQAIILEGREFKPTFLAGHVPIALTAPNANEDKAGLDIPTAALADGRRKRSASGMMQEFLNADDARLWGFAFDGRVLRLLRDNASLTRPAFIEFDISRIVGETLYSEFSTLWLLCHVTRFQGEPNDCIIEGWKQSAKEDGIVARDKLQLNLRAMLSELGNGLLENPRNDALRIAIRERQIDKMQFQGDLLRLAYRVIFLITIEDRGVLHAPDATIQARELYRSGYSLARIRDKALSRVGEARHHDLWLGLRLILGRLAVGDRTLGLPALGGLFDGRLCIDDAVVSNKRLISGLRHLFWMQTPTGVVKVNWKDMATEEFGSVYEGLLELVPTIAAEQMSMAYPGDGQTSSRGKKAGGNKRKTTGSYYTPDSLVEALLDTTLDPIIDEAVASSDDPVSAIQALKVIDPAVGSGHFLLGAARRLATRIVQIRFDGAETPEDWRHSMREVVQKCIYGVDANLLAIDLCKVGLWLESVEPGKPLTFLDSKIRHGNSLFGVHDLELLKKGIPANAYDPLPGDDKKAARYYRDLNAEFITQQERNRDQLNLDLSAPVAAIAELDRRFEQYPEETRADLHAKAEEYRKLREDEQLMRFTMAANIYAAAFFAPKNEIRKGLERSLRAIPISFDVLQIMKSSDHSVPDPVLTEVKRLDQAINFFHWPLEFAGVMDQGGFDVVIGNPPWEKMEFKDQEFFAKYSPVIANAANQSERKKAIQALAEAPDGDPARTLFNEFQIAKRASDAGKVFVRSSGRFPLTATGITNLYALFAEHFRSIAKTDRRAGLICPTGIATEKNTSRFFGDLVEKNSVVSLFDFENRRSLFKGVDSRTKFCLLTMGSNKKPVSLASYLLSVSDLAYNEKRYTMSADQIARINPNTKTIPLFRAKADADLTSKIHDRVPIVFREGADDGNPWGLRFTQGLFNMSSDSGVFRDAGWLLREGYRREGRGWVHPASGQAYSPLYEAKMVHHFDHRWATYEGATEIEYIEDEDGSEKPDLKPCDVSQDQKADPNFEPEGRYFVPRTEVDDRLRKLGWNREWLIGWRDICRATDERSLIASVIPASGVGHTFCLLFPIVQDVRLIACLLANMNSLTADYITRQKLPGTHLTYNVFKQVALLKPNEYSNDEISWVSNRVARLCHSSVSMSGFARDIGWNAEAQPLKDHERRVLRAELDSFFARKYGLSRVDLQYVLDPEEVKGKGYPSETFRGLREKEMKEFNAFRTADLVLDAWDRMEKEGLSSVNVPASAHGRQPVVDISALPNDAWSRSNPQPGDTGAALTAVLKAISGPTATRTIRMAVVMMLEPQLLTPILPIRAAVDWRRCVGSEADPRAGNVVGFVARINLQWRDSVSNHRGNGRLVEDLAARTWAPGQGLGAFHTSGWADGRARFVLDALQALDMADVVNSMPDDIRGWIADAAAA